MNKIIYCFWTGDNLITENRLLGLKSLSEKSEVEVMLITKDNLNDYVLNNYPLHDCYNHLNPTHRSDYLRCYFMNFYGGGYSDIKSATHSWLNSFDLLSNSPDKYILGYKEIGPGGVAYVGGELYKELTANWFKLIGCGNFICKPHTPFTEEWYNNMMQRMDERSNDLRNRGDVLEWTEIMGNIFHPLCLKYSDNIIQDDNIRFDFSKPYK